MEPFLKWAGGKRWLLPVIRELVSRRLNCYFEPFLGGAAVALDLLPKAAFLSDKNVELIETYKAIQDHPTELDAALRAHHERHSDEYYYALRASNPADRIEAAARFIYLNRTCWNGLYRVNLRGQFNVPRGTKNDVIYLTDDFIGMSVALAGYRFETCDFEEAISRAGRGDLVYADPPYTVAHNLNGFLKYNSKIFSWDDQVRLEGALRAAHRRGAMVLVSNADHESVRELYADWPEKRQLTRHSVIAGSPSDRRATTELLVLAR